MQVINYRAVTLRRDDIELEEWPQFGSDRASTRHFFGINGTQVSVFER